MTAPKLAPGSVREQDELATRAALALIECRARAAEAEQARKDAADARDEAVGALHAAGWSLRQIARELDCSHELIRRMVKAHRERSWGGFTEGYTATPSLSELAEEYRVARVAQELRAEKYARGDRTALDAFYRRADTAAADDGEAPMQWGDWMKHRSAMLREDA